MTSLLIYLFLKTWQQSKRREGGLRETDMITDIDKNFATIMSAL